MKKTARFASLGLLAWASCQASAPADVAGQRADARAPSLPARAKEPPLGTAAMASPDDVARARTLFAARCQMCHGPKGQGDGPMAAMLSPKPRSFAERAWQAQATDEHIAAIILRGGQAVGRSAAMPAMPELSQKPADLAGLVQWVRQLGQAESP